MLALLLLESVFLLLRGHNMPGGGFIGGLVAAAAFALYGIAYGVEDARYILRVSPQQLIGAGLLSSLASGLFALFRADTFLAGQWLTLDLAGGLKLGTPLLFDLGVYLVVVGITLMMIFSFEEA
jgi:multisubunit Na+/H+ antiporter MnhB subunit